MSKANGNYSSLSPNTRIYESGPGKPLVNNVVIQPKKRNDPVITPVETGSHNSDNDEYYKERTQDLLKKQNDFNNMQEFYKHQIEFLRCKNGGVGEISIRSDSLENIFQTQKDSMANLQDSESLLVLEESISKHNTVSLSAENPEYIKLLQDLQ